jgi:hypothetical protein
LATDNLALGIIEETDDLVTIKRENIIADGVYEESSDVWLLTVTDRIKGVNIDSGKVDTKYEALVWCLDKTGFTTVLAD